MIAALLAAVAVTGTPFDYDATKPLDVREVGAADQQGIVVHDLSYAAGRGGRVPGYLVVPSGAGPFGGVLVAPGGGEGRDDALTTATALARRGLVALTIDPPNVRPGHAALGSCGRGEAADFREYVVELRRGLDLLMQRPEIDPDRLGFAGFSYGAAVGAVLAGVDHRLKVVALASGAARLSSTLVGVCRTRLAKARLAAYRAALRPLDAIAWIGRAAPAELFLQNGRSDRTYPRGDVAALHRAASSPKTVRWYTTGHTLSPGAFAQRDDWLVSGLAARASPALADDARAADVRLLVRELERLHPNPFHDVSREGFHRAADELAARAPQLGVDQYLVEVMRLAALGGVREGHQGVFPADPAHPRQLDFYPLRLYRFAEGTFVVDATDRALVGARLDAIDGRALGDVEPLIRALVPHDNESSMIQRLPDFEVAAQVLHGLGLAAERTATFSLTLRDGTHRDATLRAAGRALGAFWDALLPPGIPAKRLPLVLRLRDEPSALRTIDRGRVVYLAYNSVTRGVNAHVPKLLRLARKKNVRRIVIDLRLNGGGNNTTYIPLLDALTKPAINRPGRLVVLIGRNTFSAAGSFAADVDRYTGATFFGEPTGGAPNQYGDATSIVLPAAGLSVHVATSYQEFGAPGDTRLAIEPDVPVPVTAADFFAGRDPVLAAAIGLD